MKKLLLVAVLLALVPFAFAQFRDVVSPDGTWTMLVDSQGRTILGGGVLPTPNQNLGIAVGMPFYNAPTKEWCRYGGDVWNCFGTSGTTEIADNVATAFHRIAIPQTLLSNYAAGQIQYTITCSDGINQATQHGSVHFACQNLAGTEACGFGTPDGVTLGDGTAAIDAPVFTGASTVADTINLLVQSNCTGVTPTTDQIQYTMKTEQPNTMTRLP